MIGDVLPDLLDEKKLSFLFISRKGQFLHILWSLRALLFLNVLAGACERNFKKVLL